MMPPIRLIKKIRAKLPKTRWSSTGKMKIRTYNAPDGTPVSIKDMDYLLEVNKTNPATWLKGYKKWRMNKERSDTMAKKKKAKKKVSTLDKIRKQMDKLETLHEKEADIVFDINEMIDDAQMEDDFSDD
tara:strand:+ start:165 stop:551 length:387 start_codon:yes stop_codon:yes gene_type:complete